MAIITPEVSQEPIPGARDQAVGTPTAFGGGPEAKEAANEVQKMAIQTGDIAALERIRFDQTAAQEGKAKLSAIYSDLLYNPQSGVLASRGVNSMPAQEQASQKFKQASNDISSSLSGDAQKGIFNREALGMWEGFNRTGMAHVSQEMEKHQVATFDALVKNETERATLAYGDPKTRTGILDGLNNAVDQFAQSRGLDDEQKQNLRMNVQSNYHEKVVDAMASAPGFFPAAKEYYYTNRENIDSNTRERIEKVLGEGDVRYGAQSAVHDILSKTNMESDALKQADKIDDADQRDMARKMISSYFQQNRAAERNDQDQLFLQWGQKIGQAKLTDPIEIRNAIPADVWSKLRNEQRTALMKSGEDTVTSPKKWLDFMEEVKGGDIVKMSRADLEEQYLPYFDTADKKRAEDIWVSGKRGPKDAKLMNVQSTQQRIDTALVNAGLVHAKSRDRGTRDAELIKDFTSDVVSSIDQYEASSGKSPTPDEIQTIVDSHTRQYFADHMVKVPSGSFIIPNSQKPVSILTDAEKGQAYVPYSSIPAKDASTLEGLMRQNQKTVSRDKVSRAYAAYLIGDKKRMREVVNE